MSPSPIEEHIILDHRRASQSEPTADTPNATVKDGCHPLAPLPVQGLTPLNLPEARPDDHPFPIGRIDCNALLRPPTIVDQIHTQNRAKHVLEGALGQAKSEGPHRQYSAEEGKWRDFIPDSNRVPMDRHREWTHYLNLNQNLLQPTEMPRENESNGSFCEASQEKGQKR